jgi:hypothetical protein
LTDSSFLVIARRMAGMFASAGFTSSSELVDPISDNGVLEMQSGDLVLRLVRDRTQWFVEMRSATADEWFDGRFVLALVDGSPLSRPPRDEATLRAFVEHLVSRVSQWQLLFHPDMYAQTKRELNEKQLASARKRLNYKPTE